MAMIHSPQIINLTVVVPGSINNANLSTKEVSNVVLSFHLIVPHINKVPNQKN